MKKIVRVLFYCFLFLVTFFVSKDINVSAKSASSEVFDVVVGNERLPVYYELVDSGEVKEMLKFQVELKGKENVSKSYRWEHTFCYKVVGEEEVCEVDLTGEDQPVLEGQEKTKILSDTGYSYTYFDEDMPYYSETLEFEYITFKNKFVSLDGSNKEIVLEDISFLGNEIDYSYNFDVIVNYVEKNNEIYGGYRTPALFVNNSASNLELSIAPTYAIVNEICVSQTDCYKVSYTHINVKDEFGYTHVREITPYVGNINFSYDSSEKYENSEFSNITYKTTLECKSNCSGNRRIQQSKVAYEQTVSFDGYAPYVDVNNTHIGIYDGSTYFKEVEIKITMKDDITGVNLDNLKYYIVTPYYSNACNYGTEKEYSFSNGESFKIGSNLTGRYCMYYVAYDNVGNSFVSDYFQFYFDNSGPSLSVNGDYDEEGYYNEIAFTPSFSDNHSGFKEAYYLWSKDVVDYENYLIVKNNGEKIEDNIYSSSIKDDGAYYLYVLTYDKLDNYKLYKAGPFNVDLTPLVIDDITIESDFIDGFNSNKGVTVTVDEMADKEQFKCGFLNTNNVDVSDLNLTCFNNTKVSLPQGMEGNYDFYIYIHDRANNYSLIRAISSIKIDTKNPLIEYDILYDDDEYRIANEIVLNVSDLNALDAGSLKYGWFLANKGNVVSSDLNNSFVNGSKINYPKGYYGEYKLYVSAKDSIGNETFIALGKIFKIDTDIIRISLVGENEITIIRGEKYVELGAKAYKGEIGSASRVSDIKVVGEVDINKTGTYYLTYSSGEGDLMVSVTRKIVVKNDVPYLLVSGGLLFVGVIFTSLRLFVRRKSKQNI